MKTVILISDDYVWAPKVLRQVLEKRGQEIAAIAGIPGTSNHHSAFAFIKIYLNLLYPALFAARAVQTLWNRLKAQCLGGTSSVSKTAAAFKIPYKRFENINDPEALKWFAQFSPQVFISIQTQFIRKELQTLAPKGVINIHPAKLPAYRGPAPLFWVLYHREKETGVSAHFVNEKFDDGAIIAQESIPISEGETYFSLGEKITASMPAVVLKALETVERGGPYSPNTAFEGCYQSYPNGKQAFEFHLRPLAKAFRVFS